MRVIVVNDFARINGGAGKVAIESALALAGAGTPTHLFAAALTPDPAHEGVPNLTVTGLDAPHVNDLPIRRKLLRGISNPEIGEAFDRVLAQYDSNDTVVHIHSLRDANTLAIVRPIVRRGFPWLMTAHDYMLTCPYSGFYDHEFEAICTRKPMGLTCITSRCNGGSRVARMWFLARFVAQNRAGLPGRIPLILAPSDAAGAILRRDLPPDLPMETLLAPIGPPPGPRVEAERNRGFLYVGRFSPEKGAVLFAEAAARASVPAEFVGKGVQEEEIRRANPEAAMSGWLDRDGVQDAVARSRAVVFPSRWYETFGLSALEAVAAGVPVLVSDAAVTREIPETYGSGTLFPTGDANALASLLTRVAGDDELVRGWSETGWSRYAEAPLTMDRHREELLEIYGRVLARTLAAA